MCSRDKFPIHGMWNIYGQGLNKILAKKFTGIGSMQCNNKKTLVNSLIADEDQRAQFKSANISGITRNGLVPSFCLVISFIATDLPQHLLKSGSQ